MKIKVRYNLAAPFGQKLVQLRGIEDYEGFVNPDIKYLQDPYDLDNMDRAVAAVKEYAQRKVKRSLVIVDSDADGQCSSAILILYLKECYPDWQFDYVLHERKGHGLSDIVDNTILDDYEVVFVPDAGANDDEYYDMYPDTVFIVLDHHLRTSKDPLPANVIHVNNQTSPKYINKELSGAGVTWQFCRAYDTLNNTDYANHYIDLCATAVIADIMDISTYENRWIVHNGLRSYKNTFLRMLQENASFKIGDKLTPNGVAFYIVPMINSMCRMGTQDEKDRMFLSFIDPFHQVESHKRGSNGIMVNVVTESVRECTNAKARQSRMQEKMATMCEKQIIEQDLLNNKIITIVLDEDFDDIPSEMNGLTATKIANDYGHPTLIGRVNSTGDYQGSIRGLTTIDMPPFKEFLNESGLFNYVEGHNNAAGFGIKFSKLDKFNEWANEYLRDVDLNEEAWDVDYSCYGNDKSLTELIHTFATMDDLWGTGFNEPIIHVNKIRVNRSDISVMGKSSDTVKVMHNGIAYMFFKCSMEQVKELTQYQKAEFEIVGTANWNNFRGMETPQVFVKGYEIRDDRLGF